MKNQFERIMTFKKFISFFNIRESLKETQLDNILDKISSNIKLSQVEQDFLDNYSKTDDDDLMDYKMLSKESTFTKIESLLKDNKKVICNLFDKSGKIGIQIVSIYSEFDSEECTMTLKNREKVNLKDSFLYNIVYNNRKDEYSLEAEDEFYEKIPASNRK